VRRRLHRTDLSQPDIVAELRKLGDQVSIIGRPVDLLIRSGSKYWTAEVKTPGKDSKKRQLAQVNHATDADTHNSPHFVLMTIEDAIRARNIVLNVEAS
jgi:hypothetical protein